MVTLRCTASLLKRLGAPAVEQRPTGALGDWYAKTIAMRPRHLAICTNERTLLSVVVPVAPAVQFLDRFIAAARHRINQIPVAPELRLLEIGSLVDVQLGRTSNRSVMSSMNQFVLDAEAWFEREPTGDLEDLGLWLCDTPCSPLSTGWPWLEAELRLSGSIAPESRGSRSFPNAI